MSAGTKRGVRRQMRIPGKKRAKKRWDDVRGRDATAQAASRGFRVVWSCCAVSRISIASYPLKYQILLLTNVPDCAMRRVEATTAPGQRGGSSGRARTGGE